MKTAVPTKLIRTFKKSEFYSALPFFVLICITLLPKNFPSTSSLKPLKICLSIYIHKCAVIHSAFNDKLYIITGFAFELNFRPSFMEILITSFVLNFFPGIRYHEIVVSHLLQIFFIFENYTYLFMFCTFQLYTLRERRGGGRVETRHNISDRLVRKIICEFLEMIQR